MISNLNSPGADSKMSSSPFNFTHTGKFQHTMATTGIDFKEMIEKQDRIKTSLEKIGQDNVYDEIDREDSHFEGNFV